MTPPTIAAIAMPATAPTESLVCFAVATGVLDATLDPVEGEAVWVDSIEVGGKIDPEVVVCPFAGTEETDEADILAEVVEVEVEVIVIAAPSPMQILSFEQQMY